MANSPATCIGVFSNSVCGCCALRRCQSAYQWQTPRTCLEFRGRCQGCCRMWRPLPTGWKDLEEMEAEAFTGSFFSGYIFISSTYFRKMLGTRVYDLLPNHLKDASDRNFALAHPLSLKSITDPWKVPGAGHFTICGHFHAACLHLT